MCKVIYQKEKKRFYLQEGNIVIYKVETTHKYKLEITSKLKYTYIYYSQVLLTLYQYVMSNTLIILDTVSFGTGLRDFFSTHFHHSL